MFVDVEGEINVKAKTRVGSISCAPGWVGEPRNDGRRGGNTNSYFCGYIYIYIHMKKIYNNKNSNKNGSYLGSVKQNEKYCDSPVDDADEEEFPG